MSNIILILAGSLLFLGVAFSAEKNIDIEKAATLEKIKKYEEALKILAPCLNAKHEEVNNLEKCLYHGEEITVKGIRSLILQYQKQNKTQPSGLKFENWLKNMGIKVNYNNREGWPEYNHNYIKHLIKLFPNSKHRDVYDYVIIERGYNSMKPVQEWINLLSSYREKYPNGYYIFNATTDLANAYDDLWELLTPSPEFGGYFPYYSDFSSGNKDTDEKNAEIFRKNALELYTYLMKYGIPKTKYEKYLLQESMERIKTLTDRKHSSGFYIIND